MVTPYIFGQSFPKIAIPFKFVFTKRGHLCYIKGSYL